MDNINTNIEDLRSRGKELMKDNHLAAAKELLIQICGLAPEDVDAWYTLSNINGMLGDMEMAGECSRRVLELQSDHCEAHVNLGNVLLNQGKHAEAAAEYQKALHINPDHPAALGNLGNALSVLGRYDEAERAYQAVIQLNPNWSMAFFNLGNLRMLQKQYDKAVNNYMRAVTLNPAEAQLLAIRERGELLVRNNHLVEAKALFAQLCRTNPADVQAWHTLSIINGRLGELEEAGDCCRRVLALQSDHSEALINLGHVFFQQGQFDEAIDRYEKVLEINPRSIPALNNLGKACHNTDNFQRYELSYRKAISMLVDPAEARIIFVSMRKNRPLTEYDPWLDEELQKYYATSGVDYRPSTSFTAQLLRLKYMLQPPIDYDGEALSIMIERFAADNLFLQFLEKALNTDEVIETVLTILRRELLVRHWREKTVDRKLVSLMAALAFQCLNNEYVFNLDAEERRWVVALRQDIELNVPLLRVPDLDLEGKLFVFGMYERLYVLACREHLSSLPRAVWSDSFRPLMERALLEPLEEERIKTEVFRITDIEDQTSQLVQSQYEENPYPRWVSISENRKRNVGQVLKQLIPHFKPPEFLNGPIRILIAGCGTGKHAIKVALSYDNAEVLAVDISKSSLAYAIRMAHKYDVHNIRFMQGDILQLSKLDMRFHIIESSGVLHHMEDPLKGWKVLADLLVDNGLMYIGLYSEKARKQIVAAREIIKNENITPDLDNIRKFRSRILKRELGEPLYVLARNSYDFYSVSGCRDLLFHFKEHRFTVSQISDAIDELHLKFIGFILDNADTENLYHAQFPEDRDMKNLLQWDEFESLHPGTFGKMYQFWCQRRSAVRESYIT